MNDCSGGTMREGRKGNLKAIGGVMLALSGWVVLAFVLLKVPVPARLASVFAFAFFCPGYAIMRFSRSRSIIEQLVFSIAVSLALEILVSEGFSLVHRFSAVAILATMAAITTSAVVSQWLADTVATSSR